MSIVTDHYTLDHSKLPELLYFNYEHTAGADHVVREASQRLQVQPDQLHRTSAHAKKE